MQSGFISFSLFSFNHCFRFEFSLSSSKRTYYISCKTRKEELSIELRISAKDECRSYHSCGDCGYKKSRHRSVICIYPLEIPIRRSIREPSSFADLPESKFGDGWIVRRRVGSAPDDEVCSAQKSTLLPL